MNAVAVLDVANPHAPALVATIPVGNRPWGVALAGDGRTVYSANGLSDDVSVIDTSTLQVTDTIPVGQAPWGVAIGPAR